MSAPIDYDAVLGVGYAALLREEFSKGRSDAFEFLLGSMDAATCEFTGSVFKEDALPRAHAIIMLFRECQK